MGDSGVSVRAGEDKGMDSGPVLASFVPFKEGSEYGIRVEGTDVFRSNPGAYRSLACKGFHSCVGSFLAMEGPNKYTGALKVLPATEQDAQLASNVASYSEGRVKALQDAHGEDIFLYKKEYFTKLKQWARQHPKGAKAVKAGLILTGFGIAAVAGYFLFTSLQNAATQQAIMNANLQYKESIELVRQGLIPGSSSTGQAIINGNASYDVAAVAKDAAMTTAVFSGVGAGVAGGASATGIAVPARKAKIGNIDRYVGLYMMARKNYLEETNQIGKEIFEIQPVKTASRQYIEVPAQQ